MTDPPVVDPGGEGRAGGKAEPDDVSDDEAILAALRARILAVDEELVQRVGERRELVLRIGEVKDRMGLPVMDPAREARVVRRAAELARQEGIDEELVRDVIWRIVASAREAQEGSTSWGPPEPPTPGAHDPGTS